LLAKWRSEKHELFHFIAAFLDRYLWIKQSKASFVEWLKLLKAIKVVEKVLKSFLKAMTYGQMTNYHARDTCQEDGEHGTTFLLNLHICSYLIYGNREL
jgi:hypothetical protein